MTTDDAYEQLAQRYAELEQDKAELAELLDRAETERDALVAILDRVRDLVTQNFESKGDFVNRVRMALEHAPDTSLARREGEELILWLADGLEAAEAPSAEGGYMWDASQCADWIREQADTAEQGES